MKNWVVHIGYLWGIVLVNKSNSNIMISLLYLSFLFPSINMEGFYEGQFGRGYESDIFEWNIWDPNLYLETRLHGSPVKNSDYYIKFYADKDFSQNIRPLAVLSEGHIGFKNEQNNFGFSSILFTRESHHFWYDGSMLGIVNTGSVNNDGNAQGARFDFWHSLNRSMTYVFSDFSQGSGDDIHLLRYRQSLFNNKLKTGFSFQKKYYSTGAEKDYNQVLAQDFKLNLGKYYFANEIAISQVPSDTLINKLNSSYLQSEFLKSNIAVKAEFRGFSIGHPKFGYYFINPGYFSYGNTYRNYMGDNNYNNYGFWINSYYLVPKRAITLILNYTQSQKIVADTITIFSDSLFVKEILDPTKNLYGEIYIEFINGFRGKLAFSKKDEIWQGNSYKHYDLLSELTVENSLAKLLAQFKVKDIGQTWEKYITGLELSVNLAGKWKVFTRGMVVNDRVGSRYSIFAELQYRTNGNTELYLQYGPSNWGQYGLVNDESFVSSGEMRKELRLIVKGWF